MKKLILFLLLTTIACDATYRVIIPYCPISDSARARADSIPVLCLADSTYKAK